MLKKKSIKIEGKKLGDLPKKVSGQQNKDSGEEGLKQIKKASEGLYYISETDAEILPFFGKQSQTVTKEEILRQTDHAADTLVEKEIW